MANNSFNIRAYGDSVSDKPQAGVDGFVFTGCVRAGQGAEIYCQLATSDNHLFYRFYHAQAPEISIDWTPIVFGNS